MRRVLGGRVISAGHSLLSADFDFFASFSRTPDMMRQVGALEGKARA